MFDVIISYRYLQGYPQHCQVMILQFYILAVMPPMITINLI